MAKKVNSAASAVRPTTFVAQTYIRCGHALEAQAHSPRLATRRLTCGVTRPRRRPAASRRLDRKHPRRPDLVRVDFEYINQQGTKSAHPCLVGDVATADRVAQALAVQAGLLLLPRACVNFSSYSSPFCVNCCTLSSLSIAARLSSRWSVSLRSPLARPRELLLVLVALSTELLHAFAGQVHRRGVGTEADVTAGLTSAHVPNVWYASGNVRSASPTPRASTAACRPP